MERVTPVTEDRRRTRRKVYRIADNFLAFWLTVLDRHRTEIDRGLGPSILPTLMTSLGDHMGARWEEAFRWHLRELAIAGTLRDIVAVGRFWTADAEPVEIDAVALAGRDRAAVLVGEAKWARRVDGASVRRELERRARSLPAVRPDLRFAICAREEVTQPGDAITHHRCRHLR